MAPLPSVRLHETRLAFHPAMTATSRRLTYRGNPAFASMLVQMLEEAGVSVEWKRPAEQRGLGATGHEVVVTILAAGAYDAIKAAIARFLERMHGKAEATVEDNPPDAPPKGRHVQ